MKGRGRPPLTEVVIRQRIAGYCSRYGVALQGETGLPPFPAGQRETRQHREWMVLYKALRRLRARQAADTAAERQQALARQRGRCPICLDPVGSEDPWAPAPAAGPPAVAHKDCALLIRAGARIGPDGLERVKRLLWPARGPEPRRPPGRRKGAG